MSPDTAALRALANNVSRLGAPQEFTDEEDFAGLGMGRAERRYYAALDPDTVRALCDAADEVERHRSMTRELSRELLKKGDEVERLRNPDIATPREREALLTVERMVTAHAALVADLRALHVREVAQRQTGHGDNAEGIWLCAECLTEYPCRTRALLDRHAPEEGS